MSCYKNYLIVQSQLKGITHTDQNICCKIGKEHRILLESGIGFVVDLSHFNIIAKRYGWDENLVIDMLSSKTV